MGFLYLVRHALTRPDPARSAAAWETAAAAGARFGGCVDRLWSESAGQGLVVVAHATVISLYLAALLGQDRVRFDDWRSIGFPDYAVVDVEARRVVQSFGAW